MKGKIYTVAVKVQYLVTRIKFQKFIPRKIVTCAEIEEVWHQPIFAYSPEKAIEKYKEEWSWEEADGCESRYSTITARTVEVVSEINTYSLNELKRDMNSQDFLDYVRQEFTRVDEVFQ